MKLIDSYGPNPRVVRMFIAEKGITVPTVEVECQTLDAPLVVSPSPTAVAATLVAAETQTEAVGAVARWQRLVFRVRKLSWLRRLKSQITELLHEYEGLYDRTDSLRVNDFPNNYISKAWFCLDKFHFMIKSLRVLVN